MKTLLSICIVLSSFYFKGQKNVVPERSVRNSLKTDTVSCKGRFQIQRIDSIQNVYIIYARRNDSTLKIVSSKTKGRKYPQIIVGQCYAFKVKGLLMNVASPRHIAGMNYDGIIIKFEGDGVIWNLYSSEDLEGLYLTKH